MARVLSSQILDNSREIDRRKQEVIRIVKRKRGNSVLVRGVKNLKRYSGPSDTMN